MIPGQIPGDESTDVLQSRIMHNKAKAKEFKDKGKGVFYFINEFFKL